MPHILTAPLMRRYAPSDRCIYCGSQKPPLTEEHIIPEGLGGQLLFPNASCKICEKRTWWAENDTLGKMLIIPRIHLETKSKHKSKRSSHLKIAVYNRIPGEDWPDMSKANFRWKDVPISEHPYALILPALPVPGMLVGREDKVGLLSIGFTAKILRPLPAELPDLAAMVHPVTKVFVQTPPYLREAHWCILQMESRIAGEKTAMAQEVHPEAFSRMILKIAHGITVAELGHESFEPYLTEYIRGKLKDFNRVLGQIGFDAMPATKEWVAVALFEDKKILTAQVQIYAQHSFPPFTVIVGRMR